MSHFKVPKRCYELQSHLYASAAFTNNEKMEVTIKS